jgi:WD40 repeat protein
MILIIHYQSLYTCFLVNTFGLQTDPHRQDLLRGHDNIVTSVAFSQSGKLLASGQKASAYRDGEQIVVWEYDTRKPLYRLSGVDGTVKSLKFSEDDRFLAAIGEGNSNGNDIAIWDMQNGSVAQYVKCTRNCATCMCWGRTVVADPSRRVKTPKYSLFSFHSVQVRRRSLDRRQAGRLSPGIGRCKCTSSSTTSAP